MKVPSRPGAFERHVLCLLDGGHEFADTVAVRQADGRWRQTASCSRCGLYPGPALYSPAPLQNAALMIAGPVPGRTLHVTRPAPKFPHPTRRTA